MKRTALTRKTPLRRKSPIRPRRKATAKGRPKADSATQSDRRRILTRDGWTCQRCGEDTRELAATIRATRDRLAASDVVWHSCPRARVQVVADEAGTHWHNAHSVLVLGRIPAEVDHITPRAAGGSGEDSNMQTLCTACYKAKTADDVGALARMPATMRATEVD